MTPQSACPFACLDTGDLLLFAGRGVTSAVIRLFTGSRWSHIGMVVRLPGVVEPLVLESTGLSESADLHLGRPVAGVALVPLSRKLQDYPGEVAVRRWQGPPLRPAQRRLVARLVTRLLHRPYKNFVLCNVRDLLSGFTRAPDRRGWFCSELVAECYRRLGWLPRDARVSGFVPGDFDCPGLRLLGGGLSAPQLLKAKSSAALSDGNAANPPRSVADETALPRRSRGFA
ncbi:C40 family peptidase [Alloalcanivorax mobilis]|uniref:YiiX/YebB-like N1pC/P60 family cysteine hydrolase n=1 Tax=Alloalcanivorax mobilis TaxID=2019569 RepID=UPI000B5B45AC|nr:YiiX/YebB-like N1pC/P60 family cysteine hydrolase [Alloalcanivorax mobilis]ASK33135.1 hypothetical protein CEK62_01410 [Alcanivorax sp. N3-2A]ASK36953.1 hypothetical protein CEK62_21605 [Alcanivorax sp. N3-2A]